MDESQQRRSSKEPAERKRHFTIWYVVAAVLGVLLFQYLWISFKQVETVSYSEFQTLVDSGKLSEVDVGPDTIQGKLKEPTAQGQNFIATVRVDPDFATKLAAKGIKVVGVSGSNPHSPDEALFCGISGAIQI
jgi:cell division protease FtsH